MKVPSRKSVRHELKCLRRLWSVRKENGASDLLGYLASRWLGSKVPRRLFIGGEPIWVRPATPDIIVAASSLLLGEFDSVTRYKSAEGCDFIIDAGAYIGTAAIALSRRFPAAHIICLEPSSDNYGMLLLNTAEHPAITPLNSALIGVKRPVHLYDKKAGEWAYTIVAPKGADDGGVVASVTVEDILHRYGPERIDILKLDIEGAEKEVLEHSGAWIGKCDVIVAELHDRFMDGCAAAYATATSQMQQVGTTSEKHLAVRAPSDVPPV